MSPLARRGAPAAGLLLSLGVVTALGGVRTRPVESLVALGVAFAFYAWAAARGTHSTREVVVVALLARCVLFSLPASDDVARYVWEGRAVLSGTDPYRIAPDASTGVNHPGIGAIYPPIALAAEALGALLGAGEVGQKAVFVALDLAVVVLLLDLRGVGARALLYAWNPLVLVAFAHEGHNDSAMLFLMTLAWWLSERGQRAAAGLALGGAFLAKIPAVVLLPAFARRLRGRGFAAVSFCVAAVLFAISGSVVAWSANLRQFGEMRFNGSLCPALETYLGPSSARWVLGAGVLAVAALFAARRPLPYAAVVGMAALLAASPTVHPWYVTWLLPFAAAAPRPWILVWSVTALLGYLPWEAARQGAGWVEWSWVPWATYLPVLAAMLWQVLLRRPADTPIDSPAFEGART